jgi:glucose dehydrogenase
MRTVLAVSAAAFLLAGISGSAMAEETTVIHRDRAPGIAVEHREGVVEHRDITTGSVDCGSKTVHKEDGMGNSKTVHKEGCN